MKSGFLLCIKSIYSSLRSLNGGYSIRGTKKQNSHQGGIKLLLKPYKIVIKSSLRLFSNKKWCV
jgi:hypothetical protein